MSISPAVLRKIYIGELIRQAKKDLHPRLLIRKDNLNKRSQMKRIRPEMENRLLKDWYAVHSKLNHKGYREFYSKILFCMNETMVSELDIDSFLELIADRRFLFLDYNESYGMPEYPPLSEIVHSPKSYLLVSRQDGAHAEDREQLRQNAQTVLRQGFVPTSGHKAAWEEWKENLCEIKNAYCLQEKLAERNGNRAEVLELQIDPDNTVSANITEERLCELFREYVDACFKNAYAEDMEAILKEERYRGIVLFVYRYLKENFPKDRVFHVLVLFHLFSQQTARVTKGSLRKYCCKPLEPSERKSQKSTEVQSTTRTRIECNIKLFDYLIELLLFNGDYARSRNARERELQVLEQADTEEIPILLQAKYRFFLFARYDQYCHYDLRKMYEYDAETNSTKLRIDFNCRENPKDGVDLFGNLLRYNIRYTMPNQVQWLQKFLTQLNPESILATLLLDEAQIMPTRARLTDRIRLLIKDDQERNMVKEYKDHFLNQEEIRKDLRKWCEESGFYFQHGDAIYERELGRNSLEAKAAAQCGQMVLDYELRAELIRQAGENLLERAEALFGDMLHPERVKNH